MKIAVIDDHKLLAESIASSLQQQPAIQEARAFFDVNSYLEASKDWHADIVLADMLMPGIKGNYLLEHYKKASGHRPKIMMLTSVTDVQSVKAAMRSGANGYMGKDSSIEELYKAITSIMENGQYISNRLSQDLVNSIFVEESVVYHLSKREKELLTLVCEGHTTKEAAAAMELSYHTVQFYHRNMMKKLKVNRTADLIIFAINNGLYKPVEKNGRMS